MKLKLACFSLAFILLTACSLTNASVNNEDNSAVVSEATNTPEPAPTEIPTQIPSPTPYPTQDPAQFEVIHSFEVEGISWLTSIDLDPVGSQVAYGFRSGHVRLWNVNSGEDILIGDYSGARLFEVIDLDFSPDGAYLAAAVLNDGVHVLDTSSWEEVFYIDRTDLGFQYTLSWSPDSQYFVAGYTLPYNQIDVYRAGSWDLEHELPCMTGFRPRITWLLEENQMVAACSIENLFRAWDLDTWESETLLTLDRRTLNIIWAPDNQHLCWTDATGIGSLDYFIWSSEGISQYDLVGYCWLFSPDGTFMIETGREFGYRILVTATGEVLFQLNSYGAFQSDWPLSGDWIVLFTENAGLREILIVGEP